MEDTTKLILDRFEGLASSDMAEFRQFFRSLRKQFPEQTAEACLIYLSSHAVDLAAIDSSCVNSAISSIAFWFGSDGSYIRVLLDENVLSTEAAIRALPIVNDVDPRFLVKFTRAVTSLVAPAPILRALGLISELGDCGPLIPWVAKLDNHPDARVRSMAAKVLFKLRPNGGLFKKQVTSDEARVRANALEALVTNSSNPDDARAVFRAALNDKHHRVVANALVGLYTMGDTEVLTEIIERSKHHHHLFRAAMSWAMGFLKDLRALPRLRELVTDESLVVRKRALHSLLTLESIAAKKAAAGEKVPELETPEPEIKVA